MQQTADNQVVHFELMGHQAACGQQHLTGAWQASAWLPGCLLYGQNGIGKRAIP